MGAVLAAGMKLAYFCCHPEHLKLGALSVASVKKHMPHIEIVHLTDEHTHALAGADTVFRFDTTGNYWKRYWTAAAALDGDILLVGTDTIFRRDISEVFEQSFDVALPHIADKKWRYDAGTIFSRSPAFFKKMAESKLSEISNDELFGEGVTRFLAEFHRHCIFGRFPATGLAGELIEIPGKIYSYVPKAADDPGIQSCAIVHYRGPRKKWMSAEWVQKGVESWS